MDANGGRQPAGLKTSDGKLWFSTQKGIVVIDPEAVPFNSIPPPVVIESVKIDNKNLPSIEPIIELKPGQTSLEINYTGLSLIKSAQVRFKYRLEGLESDWTEAGTRRSAYYSYLPPGEYNFRVSTANSDGIWNETGAVFRLTVSPPFWRTWWFIALSILVMIGLTALVYRRRVLHCKKKNKRSRICHAA